MKEVFFSPWREAATLGWMAMELSWMSLWYSALSQISRGVSYGKTFLFLGSILLAAYFLARMMNTFEVRAVYRRILFAVLILLSLYLALLFLVYTPLMLSPWSMALKLIVAFAELNVIPAEFWVMLAILLVWRRGVSMARRSFGVDRVLSSFQIGAMIIFVYGIFPQLLGNQTVLLAIFVFLFSGMIAMSVGRIHESERGRGGKTIKLRWGWIAGIGVVSLLVSGLGLAPSVWIQGSGLALLSSAILLVLQIIIGLMLMLAAPLMFLFLFLLPLIQKLLAQFSIFISLAKLQQDLQALQQIRPVPSALGDLVDKLEAAKPAVLWGILILVAVVILLGLSWKIWRDRHREEEAPESILSAEDFLHLWQEALHRRLQGVADGLSGYLGMNRAGRMLAAMRIRWIYSRLMKLSADLGQPRPAAATPLEFLPALNLTFPSSGAELAGITQAYLRVRYGEAAETSEEVEAVEAAWRRIRQTVKSARQKRNRVNESPSRPGKTS
ncbi:MAG: DUF4129 domain-containing protein [Chloroflexi bacterium]|nr:DUF4129 domain-containing protein [Chloroflexota bacterium]